MEARKKEGNDKMTGILIGIFVVLAVWMIVLLVRAALFQPKEGSRPAPEPISLPEEKIAADLLEILADGDCYRMDQLAVNGSDLKAAGVAPGPEMGRLLKAMLAEVLEDPAKNTKAYLMQRYLPQTADAGKTE